MTNKFYDVIGGAVATATTYLLAGYNHIMTALIATATFILLCIRIYRAWIFRNTPPVQKREPDGESD